MTSMNMRMRKKKRNPELLGEIRHVAHEVLSE
jgi:hypothetical protein